MTLITSASAVHPGAAPTIMGVVVSSDTGEIARLNLNGKSEVTSVLPNGYRITAFSTGKVLVQPPQGVVTGKQRAKGYNQP